MEFVEQNAYMKRCILNLYQRKSMHLFVSNTHVLYSQVKSRRRVRVHPNKDVIQTSRLRAKEEAQNSKWVLRFFYVMLNTHTI